MLKIKRVVVTAEDGTEKTFEGKGSLYEIQTGIKTGQGNKLDPVNYIELHLQENK